MKIKLITDSTSDIPEEVAKRYDIDIVSLDVIIGGETFKATKLPNGVFYEKLYDCLAGGKPLPTTSQVTPAAFESALRPYAGREDVFVVVATIAKEMSSTYYSAQTAISALGMKNVCLLDTRVTTFALGALVCELAKIARESDMPVEQFIRTAEDLNGRVMLYVSIGNLKCLRAGGRLNAASMAVGSILQLKPVVYVDGQVRICAKCIGQAMANKWITERVAAERDEAMPLYFGDSAAPEIIRKYRTVFGEKLNLTGKEEEFSMGPVVTAHAGLGCAGIAFFRKRMAAK